MAFCLNQTSIVFSSQKKAKESSRVISCLSEISMNLAKHYDGFNIPTYVNDYDYNCYE